MLQRCVQAGVPYNVAKSRLSLNIVMPAVEAFLPSPVANVDLLRAALGAQLAKDAEGCRAKCLEWLHTTHGVRIGDIVSVSGWAEPREVLLEDFTIFWPYGATLDDAEDCSMELSGPTAYIGGVDIKDNHIGIDAKIAKCQRMGARLARKFGDRVKPVAAP